MSWLNDYKAKLCSPDEAVTRIKCGNRVYYSGNAAIPIELVEALARRACELRDVKLAHVLLLGRILSLPREWRRTSGTVRSS